MFLTEDKPTVLVVDDDPYAVKLLQMILETGGYKVMTAGSGSEALAMVQAHLPACPRWQPFPIDAILLDILMPGMNGFKVCQQLKEDTWLRHIPVIMVTALKSDTDKIAAVEFGADGYIAKPFSAEELKATVKAKLQIKRREEEILRRHAELELLNAVGAAASATLNRRRVLQESVRHVLDMAPVCAVAVYQIDESGSHLHQMVQEGVRRPEMVSTQEGIPAQVVRTEQPALILSPTENELEFQTCGEKRVSAYVGIPLRGVERSLGVLELYMAEPLLPDERDITVFLSVGDRIGNALENALLFEQAQLLLAQSSLLAKPTPPGKFDQIIGPTDRSD